MRIEKLTESTKKNLLEDLLKRSPNSYGKYEASVQQILNDVKEKGDEALFGYTEKFDGVKLDASQILVTDAEIEDLDEKLIADYKHRIGADDLSTYQVLKARGFIRKVNDVERLTNAAVLLFASTVTQFYSNCRIRFIRYDGTSAQVGTRMNIIKDVNIEEPLPRIIEKAKQFLSIQLREFTALDPKTGLFKTQAEYPEFAWLEGIVNAVVHREYAMTGNYIRVTMYDDRLEILSPGKLPNLVTVNNIQETKFSRNPQIARVLTEFGLVRELNEGVKRIYADMKEHNLDEPVYTENDQAVTLILKNNIEQRHIKEKISAKSGVDSGVDFGADSIEKILDEIRKNEKISIAKIADNINVPKRTVERQIKKLKDANILAREGTKNGKWVILK